MHRNTKVLGWIAFIAFMLYKDRQHLTEVCERDMAEMEVPVDR